MCPEGLFETAELFDERTKILKKHLKKSINSFAAFKIGGNRKNYVVKELSSAMLLPAAMMSSLGMHSRYENEAKALS